MYVVGLILSAYSVFYVMFVSSASATGKVAELATEGNKTVAQALDRRKMFQQLVDEKRQLDCEMEEVSSSVC